MTRNLLEIQITTLNIKTDEFRVSLPSMTKIFQFPFSSVFLEINSNISQLLFEFYLNSSKVLEGSCSVKSQPQKLLSNDNKLLVELKFTIAPISELEKNKIPDSQIIPMKGFKGSCKKQVLNYFSDWKSYDPESYAVYLESLMLGLEKKVEATELKSFQQALIAKIFQQASIIPENAKSAYNSCTEKYKQKLEEKNKTILDLSKQKQQLLKSYEEEKRMRVQKTSSEEKLCSELTSAKNEILKLKSESRNYSAMQKLIEDLQTSNDFKDRQILTLKEKYQEHQKSLKNLADEYDSTNKELESENSRLKEQIISLQIEVQMHKSTCEELKNTNISLSSKIVEGQSDSRIYEKLLHETKLESNTLLIDNLNKEIEKLNNRNLEIVSRFKKEKDEHIEKSVKLLEEIKLLKETAKSIDAKKHKSPEEFYSDFLKKAEENIFSLVSVDKKKIHDQFVAVSEKSVYQNSCIYQSSENLSKNLLEISKQVRFYENVVAKLVNIVKECRAENLGLRERIYIMQNRLPLYIPVKGDPIDFAMAEFVNALRSPLKIPFVREEIGFYLFGSRNVKVKLISNRLFVMLSSSNMAIEEFVARYTREEVVKFEEIKKKSEIKDLSMISLKTNSSGEDLLSKCFSPLTPRSDKLTHRPSNSKDLKSGISNNTVSSISSKGSEKTLKPSFLKNLPMITKKFAKKK